MTRTFLVAIRYEDGSMPDAGEDSADIQEALLADGFDVESVKLWAAPTQATGTLFTPTPQPAIEQPPTLI